MWTKTFWVAAAERAAKTIAQALAAALTASGAGIIHAGFWAAVLAALIAGVLSLLTSVASAGIGPDGTPSLVAEPSAVALAVSHRAATVRKRRRA